jgi:hypothetical protein
MRPHFVPRTLIAVTWLAALLWHAGGTVVSVALALAIVLTWAAPLIRDRATGAPVVRSRPHAA